MEKRNYYELSIKEKEIAIIKAILRALQENGGELSNAKIKELLPEYDEILDADEVINKTKVSEKNGNPYKEFEFRFNFSRKTMIFAEIITYENQTLKLTEKGFNFNLDNFEDEVQSRIYDVAAPRWKNKSEENRKKREARVAEIAAQNPEQNNIETGQIEIEDEEDQNENSFEEELLAKLREMDPYKFEAFSRGLLTKIGIDISKNVGVVKSNDGGIDGFGTITTDDYKTTKVAIQCKRYAADNAVGSKEIDALRGSVSKFGAEYGIFITTSYFSKSAKTAAVEGNIPHITLIDGEKLVDIMKKQEYYVKKVEAYKIDERIENFK